MHTLQKIQIHYPSINHETQEKGEIKNKRNRK